MDLNPKITRMKFLFYVSIAIFAIISIFNFRSFLETSFLLILIVLTVGAIPFILGFFLQLIFFRLDIPQYIPWIVSALIIIPLWYFSDTEVVFTTNVVYKALYIVVSIIVCAGFMESGIRTLQKMNERLTRR